METETRGAVGRSIAVIVGAVVAALGIDLLLLPQKLTPAGVSGISVLLEYGTGVPAGALYAALNVPLFLLAWRQVHRSFALQSVVGLLSFSLALVLLRPLSGLRLVEDPLLSAVFGGAVSGAGAGLSMRFHGSLGGMDIIGVLVRQRLSTSVASVVLVVNVAIVAVLALAFGLQPALMTMLGLVAGAHVFDRVLTGLDRSKALLIISDRPEEVADVLMNRLHRGVTYLDGEGAYRRRRKRIVYCVARQRQLAEMKRLVRSVDAGAFVTVFDATEVIGEGFVAGPGA